MSTAESTVHKAVDISKPIAGPVVHKLEGPIKTVDGILCSGLDYIEAKIPAVKLPPGEVNINSITKILKLLLDFYLMFCPHRSLLVLLSTTFFNLFSV